MAGQAPMIGQPKAGFRCGLSRQCNQHDAFWQTRSGGVEPFALFLFCVSIGSASNGQAGVHG